MSVSLEQHQNLKTSLNFFHVAELRELARKLDLVDLGKKIQISQRISHFLETGEKIQLPPLPAASKTQKGKMYPLLPQTLMLKGNYKNDLKTRLFFQQLIGSHFHYTAFGIDWLNERWMKGQPPSYQEFADMWQAEYTRRQKTPAAPKEEWAYINFTQHFLKQHPDASRQNLLASWEAERQHHKAMVFQLLEAYLGPVLNDHLF